MSSAHPNYSDTGAVRGQLARIVASPDFQVPARLSAFLTYVVEESLAGRSNRLKAYTIATEVFGRGDDFDVLNDPVVRIEAGRLRRALERYYLLSGRDDQIVIDIPKGSYQPAISWRSGARNAAATFIADHEDSNATTRTLTQPPKRTAAWSTAAASMALGLIVLVTAAFATLLAWRTSRGSEPVPAPEVVLAVVPLANLGGGDGAFFAGGISDELLNQLARFRELRVIRKENATAADLSRKGAQGDYILEGGVRSTGRRIRVSTRLLDGKSSRILWSRVYEKDFDGSNNLEIESDIANKVAMAVAQPYGVIFSPIYYDSESYYVVSNSKAYHCTLVYYQYRRVIDEANHRKTRECLERTTSIFPNYSTGWAMLSQLYLDEDRYDLNRRLGSTPGRQRARSAAERAVSLDPSNVRALQALMTALFFSGEADASLRIGEKALALNPNDSEMLAELGSRVAQAGDWERGASMMENALERNPAQSAYYMGLIAQSYYMLGDNRRALDLIRRADLARFSIYHFVAALIYARAGLETETRQSVAHFLRMRPRFFENLSAELAMRNFAPTDRAILIAGAKQAGFPVGSITQ